MKKRLVLFLTGIAIVGIIVIGFLIWNSKQSKVDTSSYPFYERQVTSIKKGISEAPEIYAEAIDGSDQEEKLEIEKTLSEHLAQLQKVGWTNKAIWNGYLKNLKVEKKNQVQSYLKKHFNNSQLFGSNVFFDLWQASDYKSNQTRARWLLNYGLSLVGMPDDLSGKQEEAAIVTGKQIGRAHV